MDIDGQISSIPSDAVEVIGERTKKAFDFAADAAKQVLTLSTGIVALTITFQKDIGANVVGGPRILLGVTLVVYFLAVAFGVWSLHALTGSLGSGNKRVSIYDPNIVLPAVLQLGAFVVATGMIVLFAIWVSILSSGGQTKGVLWE
jgi:hypothetical protein